MRIPSDHGIEFPAQNLFLTSSDLRFSYLLALCSKSDSSEERFLEYIRSVLSGDTSILRSKSRRKVHCFRFRDPRLGSKAVYLDRPWDAINHFVDQVIGDSQ